MEYFSCVAKRTRSGTDIYFRKRYNEFKKNRGGTSTSSGSNLVHPIQGYNDDDLSNSKDIEFEKIGQNRKEEEVPGSKTKPKSKPEPCEEDDIVEDDSWEELEVEASHENGPDDRHMESEVKEIEEIEVEELEEDVHCESDTQLKTNLSSNESIIILSDEDEIDLDVSHRTRLKIGLEKTTLEVDGRVCFSDSDVLTTSSDTSTHDSEYDDFDSKGCNSSLSMEELSSSSEEGEKDDLEEVDEEESEGSSYNEQDMVNDSEEEKDIISNGIHDENGERKDGVSTDSNDVEDCGQENDSGKQEEFRNITKLKQAVCDEGGKVRKEKESGKEANLRKSNSIGGRDAKPCFERRGLFGRKKKRKHSSSTRTCEREGNNDVSKRIRKEKGESTDKFNGNNADTEECGEGEVGRKEEESLESSNTKQEIADEDNKFNGYCATEKGCGRKNVGEKGKVTADFTKRTQVSSLKDNDILKIIVDSTLDTEKALECEVYEQDAKEPCTVEFTLPLKFKFEDDEPGPEEKSDFDIMVDNLFDEMDFALRSEEIGGFDCPVVDNQNIKIPEAETFDSAKTTVSEPETNQTILCRNGKHHLALDEEIGLRCLYCSLVDLEIKNITPPFLKKTYAGPSERKNVYGKDDFSMFDGVGFQASRDNLEDPLNHARGTVWDTIPGMKKTMYPHQQEGFEFLWKNLGGSIDLSELKSSNPSGLGGCIISHAPGTGKTRLTIVFIQTFLKLFPNCRPVIIAPAGMLLTWEEEFRKWKVEFPFHNLNNLELSGKENKAALEFLTERKRHDKHMVRLVKIYSWNEDRSILGLSYNLYEMIAGEKFIKEKGKKKKQKTRVVLDKQVEQLRKILLEFPGLIVFDEGHTPRNERSRIWNTLLKIQTERRIILSGTPFQNNFGELFNTLRLVRPEIANVLAKEKTFMDMIPSRGGKYFRRKWSEKGEFPLPRSRARIGNYAIEKLKAIIAPFVHVHKGSILQKSLPGMRDTVVLLTPSQLQKNFIDRNRIEASKATLENEHKMALISVHPCLLLHCSLTDMEKSTIDQVSLEQIRLNPDEGVKTRFIMELVRLCDAMNERVLIFSQYLRPLQLLKDQLREIFSWNKGKEILQMKGKIDPKQRQNLINLFNDPKTDAKVLLASIRCCSEGINLVGASRVILLDVVWNPSVERQAISRAYRLGQKKVVHTYHLMTSGTTEGDKYCRQAEKDRLSELVFCSTSKENEKQNFPSVALNDKILEEMVGHEKLKDMFEKIIHQPKEKNLIESFTLVSL